MVCKFNDAEECWVRDFNYYFTEDLMLLVLYDLHERRDIKSGNILDKR